MATDAEAGRPGTAPTPRPRAEVGVRNPVSKFINFCRESAAELKKVEWPGQNQVVQGTVVVLVACIIVGTFLWVNDQVWKEVVKKLIGQ
jgi:preprotein translocase SecE subunit